jgi:hypothetical protein
MDVVAMQSQALLDSQKPLHPLCRQSGECAGWGAQVQGLASFPIITLDYNDATKTWHGLREPEQAQVTPLVQPGEWTPSVECSLYI